MKKIFWLSVMLFNSILIFSQAPELMSYQSIIRDASGALVQNQNVGIQISILQGSETGAITYIETHTVITNDNGLVTLSIGSGNTSDDIATINWETGPYYIKSETDPLGGTNYTIVGTSQLLSVPYALYAKSSGNANPQVEGANVGDMLYWNGDNWLTVPVGLPGQFLRLSEDSNPVWSGINFPEIQAEITDLTESSVTFNHEIVSNGDAIITRRGMCWSTNPNPIVDDNNQELPYSNSDNPVVSISFNLLSNTSYYARPYVISEFGITYGEEIYFTTYPTYPVIQAEVVDFTQFSATFRHEIVSEGTATITARGMCWNTSPNPLISDNNQELSYTNFSNPVIDINYNQFILNTLYYVRPYVISELGITYGEEISFTTQSINDIAVGNAYQGGMVGYILQPEDLGYDASTPHGLIIYFENENYELYSNYWGCDAITIDGTLPDFGAGQANTTAIINGCNDPNSAAKYCDDLISDGYEDWFLPSIEELGRINTNSNIIYESMGFDYSLDLICWTSTEDYDDIYNPFLPSPYIDAVYVYYFGSVTPSTETDVFPKIENASHPTPIPNVMAVRWF